MYQDTFVIVIAEIDFVKLPNQWQVYSPDWFIQNLGNFPAFHVMFLVIYFFMQL